MKNIYIKNNFRKNNKDHDMKNTKKIMFHLNSMGKGGAERVVSILSKCFLNDGYEVIVVTLWRAEEEYEIAAGIKRINLGDRKNLEHLGRILLAFRRMWDIRNLVKHEKPDIVISFCKKANFRCAYSMIGLKTPLLVSVRNDPKVDYLPYRRGTQRMERKASGCVFQTRDALLSFDKKFQKKSRIIWNPLDDKYLLPDVEKVKKSTYIVSVGRLSVQKNQILLLKAFHSIMDEFPEYELRIYGEESNAGIKEKLLTYIEQNNMQMRVKLMGQSSNLENEIRDASLFVLSSNYEGMPNALIEAMALGIPSISTDCPCGGPRELIEDGISGVLVPVENEKEMVAAIKRLLRDRDLAEKISENGKKIKEKVSSKRIYQEWKRFVSDIIGE